MIILVAVVLAIVGYRALFRAELQVDPQAVDYREAGEAVAAAGLPVVVPTALPDGWIATTAEPERGRTPVWRMGVLTDDERFVGLRLADLPAEELIEDTYPEATYDEGAGVTVPGAAVATDWETWELESGDLAWAAEVDGGTLLVHGSAPAEALEEFVTTLEALPAAPAQPSSS